MDLNSIKSKIVENKKTLFVLFLLFLLGFGIRAYLIRFELFFEFDSYWHARVVSYLIQNGSVPDRDPLAYYQMGGSIIGWKMFPIWWYSSAWIYNIFTLWGPYNEAIWIFFVKLIPAFWGAMTAIAMYFLFKELYNDRKAGYLGAFFAAVTPAFVYRTMAGFFEGASMTFFPMVLGFYFAVRAIKRFEDTRNALINSVLAGVFFSLSLWVGGGWYLIAFYVLVASIIFVPLVMLVRGIEIKKVGFTLCLILIIIGVFTFFNLLKGDIWINGFMTYFKAYSPINPTAPSGVLAQSVGEQNPGYPYFGTKYNALYIFPLLSLAIVPIWLWRKKKDFSLIIILIWIIAMWYMAVKRLQMTYAFGLGVAAAGAVVTYSLYYFSINRQSFEKKLIGLFIGFMMLLGIASGAYFMTQNTPNIEYNNSWKDALAWLRTSTPADAKVFNWWDEGHWITFVGKRKDITDNRNMDTNANIDVGKFVISEDEASAYEIMKKYDSDYIVFGSDLLSKESSLAIYAYYNPNDPRINRYLGAEISCSKNQNSITGEVTYACGNMNLSEAQINSFPTQYISAPNTFLTESLPGFIYREKNNYAIYVFNAASNKTTLVRIWFNDPALTHFKEVYVGNKSDNFQVKIFQVIK